MNFHQGDKCSYWQVIFILVADFNCQAQPWLRVQLRAEVVIFLINPTTHPLIQNSKKQAGAELGQAQSKLGLFQKDFELCISFARFF